MSNNLFDVLNWIFKSKNEKPDFSNVSPYIINRWISMSSNDFCHIVNITTNRWLKKTQTIPYFEFYRQVLPKSRKKIKYIKKNKLEETNIENIKNTADNKELSCREILFLEKQLELLNTITK
jgi:hypothetical protein